MPLPGVFGELPRIGLSGTSENSLSRTFVNKGRKGVLQWVS